MKIQYIVTSIAIMALAITAFLIIDVDKTVVRNTSRPNYNSIDPDVFGDLPAFPMNFTIIKRDVYAGQITDVSMISEDVYKQPEFYPTWESSGLQWFNNHDYSRWGVHGYGFFPGELSYTVSNITTSNTIDIYSFLHASWGIETWQGLKLIPVYGPDFFDVSIVPNEILLEPTFPKFYSNWSQIINMKIVAKKPVPAGTYNFSVKFGSPSNKLSSQWVWQALDRDTEGKQHNEIQKCINSKIESKQCTELIELRANKYVSGAEFEPSTQFRVEIKVI